MSGFDLDPIDQNTGIGDLDADFLSLLIANDRDKNRRIEGNLGRAKLRDNNRAAENEKADKKSSKNE